MSSTFRTIALFAIAALTACERDDFQPPPATPVRTEVARRAAFTPTLTLLGVVHAAQSIPVVPQQRGTIRYPQRFANGLQTGARVSRGEVIAYVENDDVRAMQNEARLEMDAAASDFERAERSHKVGVISGDEHESRRVRAILAKERYLAASKRVATLQLAAQVSGTLVVARVVPAGSLVDPTIILAEIATAGAPLVESAVAASERPLLNPGLPVTLTARGWKGAGRIAEVAAVVGESGTSRVVATIDGSAGVSPAGPAASRRPPGRRDGAQPAGGDAGAPPPGTGVEVVVQLEPRASVLTVPEDAIVAGVDGAALFVAAASEGSFNRFRVKRVAVATGGRANGRVEIVSGLHDGDRVVVGGVDALADDALASEVSDKP